MCLHVFLNVALPTQAVASLLWNAEMAKKEADSLNLSRCSCISCLVQAPCLPEGSAEHGGVALNVESKASVLILVVPEVSDHLFPVMAAQDFVNGLGYIEGNDEPRHEEHGSTIIPGPKTIGRLYALEVLDASPDGVVQCLLRG